MAAKIPQSTPYNTSEDYSFDGEMGAELSLVGLGISKCFCSCKSSKHFVRFQNGGVEMNTHESASEIIEMIARYSNNSEQAQGIMRVVDIQPDAKKVSVQQLQKVIDIFHNVLNKRTFPTFD